MLGAKGAEEDFHKAPKLIYTVILWYSFVVQSPSPPQRGGTITSGPSRHWWGDYKGGGKVQQMARQPLHQTSPALD